MTLAIDISVANELWSGLAGVEALIEQAIRTASREVGAPHADGAEVSVLLCDDGAMRALNARWRGIDKATNVLSFPAAPGVPAGTAPMLGDIAIAFETAAREAADEGKRPGDHVAHLAVHGFLHLLGHDHEQPDQAAAMEALERAILARLGIADPYGGALVLAGVRP